MVMRNFALSLCKVLKIELTATTSMGVSRGKIKVLEAIATFKTLLLPEGIGEILMALPREIEYANLVCEGIKAILSVDSLFFSRNKTMTQADLVNLPEEFALQRPENPREFVEATAMMYWRETTARSG